MAIRDDIETETADPAQNTVSLYDAVVNLYRSALQREGSPEEINAWISGTGGDLSAIHQGILASDEYKRLAGPLVKPGETETPVVESPESPGGYVPPPSGGGSGGTLGTLMQPFTQQFQAPASGDATTQIPGLPSFEPFDYPDFAAPARFEGPNAEEVFADPSYKFRFDEGNRALTNSRAAEGLLRSGGTLKDFMKWGQNLASTEYGNVFDRKWQTHKGLYDELFGEWNSGLQKKLAATTLNRDPLMEEWRTKAQTAQRQSENDYGRAWDEHMFDWEKYKRGQEWPYQVLSDQQRIGLSAM